MNVESSLEKFWREKFLSYDAIREKDEKHGDFLIYLNDQLIGFEVYAPQEPLSIPVRQAVYGSSETKSTESIPVRLPEGSMDWILTTDIIHYPNPVTHRNQLLQRIFDQKSTQFRTNRVSHTKIMIVDLSTQNFVSCDIHGLKLSLDFASFNKNCCAVYLVARYDSKEKSSYIKNLEPNYPLTDDEHTCLLACLQNR